MRNIKKTYNCGSVLTIETPKDPGGKVVMLTLEPNYSPDVRVKIGKEFEPAHFFHIDKVHVQIYTHQIAELIASLQKVIDKYGVKGW